MEDTKELITTDDIRSKVYIIRGQQVMLDKDLTILKHQMRCSGVVAMRLIFQSSRM